MQCNIQTVELEKLTRKITRTIPFQFWELVHTLKNLKFYGQFIFNFFLLHLKKKLCYQIKPWQSAEQNKLKVPKCKLEKKKTYFFSCLTFEIVHKGPRRRPPNLAILGISSLFPCLWKKIFINLVFLMTTNRPLQAKISIKWYQHVFFLNIFLLSVPPDRSGAHFPFMGLTQFCLVCLNR